MDEEKYTMTDKPMERSCEDQAKEVWKKLHNFIYHEKEDIQIIKEALQSKQKTIEELRAEVEFISTEVYKEAVAEGIHDKMDDLEAQLSRLREVLRKKDEALRSMIGTHGEPCKEQRLGSECNAVRTAKEALSLPLDQKEPNP